MTNLWTGGTSENYEAEQAERTKWFAKIEPFGNWKFPIATWVFKSEFEQVNEACKWFTGAPLKIEGQGETWYWVTSPGYYATIGA